MATAAMGEELSCSICLDLYTEPVSLKCGHNFCQECIRTVLDAQEKSGVYSCPECREEHAERPKLDKNRKLCNVVENFQSMRLEKSEILCTYCVDSPVAAVKTCLQCGISMCEKHLMAHNKTVDHMLVEPTSSFGGIMCSIHKKLLEYYCSKDAACLCVSCCLVGKHKGHTVELLEEASEKKKEKLRNVQQNLTTDREETEKKILNLQNQKTNAQEKADGEKIRVTAVFGDIRKQLEVQEKRVLDEISRMEEQVSLSISSLIKDLEVKKDELSRKIAHIENMCNMTDPITVLQDQESYTDKVLQDEESDTDNALQDEESDTDNALRDKEWHTDNIIEALESEPDNTLGHEESNTDNILQDHDSATDNDLEDDESDSDDQDVEDSSVCDLDDFLMSLVLHKSITDLVSYIQLKNSFSVQEATDLLLDENTAHNFVSLSEDLRTAAYSETSQVRSDLPERFSEYYQVMSRDSFSCGKHYWEVEVGGCGEWDVSVCYPSIDRTSDDSILGCNNKSWSFRLYDNKYEVLHPNDDDEQELSLESPVQRLGIYLDYEGGRLSFYQLDDPIKHLHTCTATFTEPIHAAFYVNMGAWVKIISPVFTIDP